MEKAAHLLQGKDGNVPACLSKNSKLGCERDTCLQNKSFILHPVGV